MTVVVVYDGSKTGLAAVTALAAASWRIGLYQNDWLPQPNQGITAVVPATFSGYAGLLPLPGWTVPVMQGDQAYSSATQRLWLHDGGLVSNWIYGVYVVDGAGVLMYAERVWDEPIVLHTAVDFAAYTPVLTQETKYAGR